MRSHRRCTDGGGGIPAAHRFWGNVSKLYIGKDWQDVVIEELAVVLAGAVFDAALLEPALGVFTEQGAGPLLLPAGG